MSLGLHGCKRVERSAEVQLALERKERHEVLEYRQLCDEYAMKRRGGVYGREMLDVTYQVLIRNPDFYTAWNDRRRALEANGLDDLKAELALTQVALRLRPKTYWIWNHRLWALTKLDQKEAWVDELHLTDLLLNLDSRNFHGWDYRRQVIHQLLRLGQPAELTLREELAFTETKIRQSFSNGSAWHRRATLLMTLGLDLAKEQNLVKNAFYTDPEDQSAFLYYRWLTTSSFAPTFSPPVSAFPRCHMVAQLAKDGNVDIALSLTFAEGVRVVDLAVPSHPDLVLLHAWRVPTSGASEVSRVWKCLLRVTRDRLPIPLSFALYPENVNVSGKRFPSPLMFHLELDARRLQTACVRFVPVEGTALKVDLELDVHKRISYLRQEIEGLQELVELEPLAKWPLLTQRFLEDEVWLANEVVGFFTGKALDSTPHLLTATSKQMETLVAIDPLRRGYYLSFKS